MHRSRSAARSVRGSGGPLGWEHLHAPDLRGRTIVMTGASDGLGREAALQLARWGADLVLGVRSRSKGETVRCSRGSGPAGCPGARAGCPGRR